LSNTDLDSGLVDYFLGDFTTPPSLGIPIMASWTPPDVEIELIDDNCGDPIDYDDATDLVAINCFTPQAMRAFEIADQYRAHGKKVIMGGFFPSFMVDECLKHADSVNVGEVEPTWPTIIEDARRGELKPKYVGGSRFDPAKIRVPRRDIFYNKKSYTWEEDLVQITRGCSYECAMCAIPNHMGHRIRFRPVDKVVEEIKSLKYENVYLADDVFFFQKRRIIDYTTELFKALKPLHKKYFVSSTLALNTDPAFLDLAAEAGVCNFYCTMNVDPVSIRALQGGKKEQQQLFDLVKNLEDRGIRFFGSFAVGRDWDDTSIADRILELYTKANIHTSEFFLFTPYPGTKHWDRLDRQGRIFDKDWSHYNGAHVVAEHPSMSVEELNKQFITIWNEFFAIKKKRHVGAFEPLTYKEGKEIVGIPLQQRGVRKQAVVTGLGVISPIGNDTRTVTDALREGNSGLRPIEKFNTEHFRTAIGGEIKQFTAGEYCSEEELAEYSDAYIHYAVAAARDALKDSGLNLDQKKIKRNVALVLGTCNGGLLSAESEYQWKHGKLDQPFDEKMNLQAQYYGFGKAVARSLGIGGDVWLATTACSATTGAIGIAQMLINRGYYDLVLVGGSDSLCVANMSGFDGLKATSSTLTAPFSTPVGLNIGEAACFWVVEEMEKAILRHAHCYAKIAGHATSSDAYHPTAPDPRGAGAFRTLRNALQDAEVEVSEIGCINAHGTGTEANDRAESKGITRLIDGTSVPVVSLKSFFGHCMGSTGILEMTCNILAMNAGFIPPTL
ncbi:MAG: radical SAM protein, partial [bacterium]|nr:radical SAM protein [bacterium]